MKILALEPFFGGSHKKWLTQWQYSSDHQIDLLTLPGRHWKWRMYGGAVSLSRKYLASSKKYDLLIASDMLDVATFKGLISNGQALPPIAVYFHENQLTYPWSNQDPDLGTERANQYAFINFTTALAADAVAFNSSFHYNQFLGALPRFLSQFPDHREKETIQDIATKSKVIHLGINLKEIASLNQNQKTSSEGVILWNHRWEYDKNPAVFFNWMKRLLKEKVPFKLVVLGQSYQKIPKVFEAIPGLFSKVLLHMGYANGVNEYHFWLQQSDILPVTSIQDFFGGSVVEAMAAGVFPILPNKLAYPEHIPATHHTKHLYQSEDEGYDMLKKALLQIKETRSNSPLIQSWALKYDWQNICSSYDNWAQAVCNL